MILQMLAIFAEGEGAVTANLAPMMIHLSRDAISTRDELYLTATSSMKKHRPRGNRSNRFRCARMSARECGANHQTRYLAACSSIRKCQGDEPPAQRKLAARFGRCSRNVQHDHRGRVVRKSGYFTWRAMLTERRIFPGMLKIIMHVSMDEARHIAFWRCISSIGLFARTNRFCQ